MLFSNLFSGSVALALAGAAVAAPRSYSPSSTDKTDALAKQALATLKEYSQNNLNPSACTFQTAAKRREWGSLCKSERRAYIKAVKCLMTKPSRLDPAVYPGAKSRYDDFVAVHINQTFSIHATANFLSWHRLFTWHYEQALRNECGYHGSQPYWNWGRWALDPLNSPLFDGSDTSLSGNGVYAEHTCTNALPTNLNCIPPGAGGGCVDSGPFADMTVNLGPLAGTLTVPGIPLPQGFFGHNPRCLRRDISSWVSSNWTTEHETWDLIANYGSTIETFQNRMQGDFATGYFGVHSAGHYTLNGDPSGDFFVSPGDPAFWLHHGQIDRVWWIWQNLQPETRTKAIGGTITLFNDPPSREGRLDDLLDMGEVLGDSMVIEEAMSTLGMTGGPFCYVYV
ncbi:putative tyrosinase [Podospora aff. communis PSN243]|uniref:Tyrosinase n=1 Tax=Podospora aff. communis PSN243 TaxID=3040156 RepID=A0AAV9GGJ3_9PEZI|nr:putative tyrosinase [Podospora aff. communis PSN243]